MNSSGKVIVFAGTNEGRILCEFLTRNQIPVTACVATEYGSLCLKDISNLDIKEGRLSQTEIREIISDYDYIIDATHPYAQVITENIQNATKVLNKKYIRIIRSTTGSSNAVSSNVESSNVVSSNVDRSNVESCEDMHKASEYLKHTDGNVLITTGSKELLPFTGIADYQERLYVRVLPSEESLNSCIQNGFLLSHIICMQGPFSEELNIAMLKQINARYLVTKDTGRSGGFDEKLSAAAKCNCKVIVIGRPVKEEGMSLENAFEYLKKEFLIEETQESYFPFFVNLENRKIVVVGAGRIAARRIKTLIDFQADITVVAPEIHSDIQSLEQKREIMQGPYILQKPDNMQKTDIIQKPDNFQMSDNMQMSEIKNNDTELKQSTEIQQNLEIKQKKYEESDLLGASFIIAATNDRQVNQKIAEDAKRLGILVNIADSKEDSDFYFPAIFSDEEIVGGIISRKGENHSLVKERAAKIRSALAEKGAVK